MSPASIAFALAVFALLVSAFLFLATLRFLRRAPRLAPDADLPPLSLLKPLKGVEEFLEENLRSVYEQDYPAPLEVVVATADADDAALPIARRVAEAYPHVPTRFVLSDPELGRNPKVSNLAGALAAASYELVLQTDGNVRLPAGYLRRIVAELVGAEADLLSSLLVGRGEQSVGAALENLQLTACISPAMITAYDVFRVPCVVGKSLLIRRPALEAVGGLEGLRDLLAEDFLLGERMHRSGYRVVISSQVIENLNQATSVRSFWARHSRWLKMRVVIHLGGFIADLLSNPVPLAFTAAAIAGFDAPSTLLLLVTLVAKIAADAYLMRRLRGTPLRAGYLLLSPIRDLLMVAIWLYSTFSRTIVWRGERLRIGAGSRLHKDEGPLPVRIVRRLLASS